MGCLDAEVASNELFTGAADIFGSENGLISIVYTIIVIWMCLITQSRVLRKIWLVLVM
ncbi:MAG: hypothetical protein IPN57_16505 [Ignavibacteria bacterium]|nr:hypothetical protein [Ignavibacteria bacterium]